MDIIDLWVVALTSAWDTEGFFILNIIIFYGIDFVIYFMNVWTMSVYSMHVFEMLTRDSGIQQSPSLRQPFAYRHRTRPRPRTLP